MRTVLHCIPTMEGGGAERQLSYLIKPLREMGWNSHIALLRGGDNMARAIDHGATVHFTPYRNHYDPAIIANIFKLCGKLRPSIMQTWLTMMDICGGIVCITRQIPWIMTERNSRAAYSGKVTAECRRLLARHAKYIVANSQGGVEYWLSNLRRADRIKHVHNAIPIADIEQVAAASKAQLDIQEHQKLILYVGRLAAQKNVAKMIEAFSIVTRRVDGVAIICGEGPLRNVVEAQIAALESRDRIRLLGYVQNVWPIMKCADVLVLVSQYEGTPNSVLEAMACGIRVVVSDIPTHRALLKRRDIIYVNPDDVVSIANGIERSMCKDDEFKPEVCKDGRGVEEYSPMSCAREYALLYNMIIKERLA